MTVPSSGDTVTRRRPSLVTMSGMVADSRWIARIGPSGRPLRGSKVRTSVPKSSGRTIVPISSRPCGENVRAYMSDWGGTGSRAILRCVRASYTDGRPPPTASREPSGLNTTLGWRKESIT